MSSEHSPCFDTTSFFLWLLLFFQCLSLIFCPSLQKVTRKYVYLYVFVHLYIYGRMYFLIIIVVSDAFSLTSTRFSRKCHWFFALTSKKSYQNMYILMLLCIYISGRMYFFNDYFSFRCIFFDFYRVFQCLSLIFLP